VQILVCVRANLMCSHYQHLHSCSLPTAPSIWNQTKLLMVAYDLVVMKTSIL